MNETKEIAALFHLIDDPDAEVYDTVSNRIISMGKAIIPNLEHLWEHTTNIDVQERIENLIHSLHFKDLSADFSTWKSNTSNLLEGALLAARYHYPDVQASLVMQDIEKIRRNIWLELSNYLTPLEQANVITGIVYNYFKLKGIPLVYDHPEDFLINKTVESKKGNALSNGVLYLVLCAQLDIPIRAVNIPRQFILGYFDPQHDALNPRGQAADKISFFIDPLNGQVYTHKEIDNYFRKVAVPPVPSYYKPLSNAKVIQQLLEELGKCFDNESNRYKMEELFYLAGLLES